MVVSDSRFYPGHLFSYVIGRFLNLWMDVPNTTTDLIYCINSETQHGPFLINELIAVKERGDEGGTIL